MFIFTVHILKDYKGRKFDELEVSYEDETRHHVMH